MVAAQTEDFISFLKILNLLTIGNRGVKMILNLPEQI